MKLQGQVAGWTININLSRVRHAPPFDCIIGLSGWGLCPNEDPSLDEAKITVAMTRLDTIWDQLFPAEQTRIVKLLVEKVIVSPNDLEVRLRQRHRAIGA